MRASNAQAIAVPQRARAGAASALPLLTALLLVMLGVAFDGAFLLRYWGPIALVVLAMLTVGRLRVSRGPVAVLVAAAWGYGVWTVVSAAWSTSPDVALHDGARNLFYAAIVTLPLTEVAGAPSAFVVARALLVLLGALVAGTLGALLVSGDDLMLAGRLAEPLGYRNATAALFALAALPLLCVAASRSAGVASRALSFSLGTGALGLAALTQSRGVALGLVAGAAVTVGLGPDRLRRTYALLAAVAGIALIWPRLTAPYERFLDDRVAATAETQAAAEALVLLALVWGCVMLGVAVFDRGLRSSPEVTSAVRRAGVAGLVVLATGLAGVALASGGDPIDRAGDKLDEFRTLTPAPVTGSRLGSTGGQRYDLWRIAVDVWAEAPVRGVGQGGYRSEYYERRATDRNLSSAHSLPLGALAETGVVGVGLLLAALVAAIASVRRGRAVADRTALLWNSALLGSAVVVLTQASVDWLWEIPALAGLALLCLGVGIAVLPRDTASPGSQSAVPLRAASAAAAVLVALLFIADTYTRESREQRSGSAGTQLDAARVATRLNPLSLSPRYLAAGALERMGRRDDARRELQGALERQPRNFVTMTLLADLEARAGNNSAARRWYRRALERNPRDIGLRQLAR